MDGKYPFEEFCERLSNGDIRLADIPILAAVILVVVVVVGGEIGCILWFFAILISALCSGAAKLLALIPCMIIFSVLTAIIVFVAIKAESSEEDG